MSSALEYQEVVERYLQEEVKASRVRVRERIFDVYNNICTGNMQYNNGNRHTIDSTVSK